MNCTLCGAENAEKIATDKLRSYYRCGACGLLFVPADGHVTLEEEKKRYALHDNGLCHKGYLDFLKELVEVVEKECGRPDRILDYGSGRSAVLTVLLRRKGYDCTPYDPLYAIGAGALSQHYEAIILCEVVEHLRDLTKEIDVLKKVSGQKGKIIIRTQMSPSPDKFPHWWYKNDTTHINFFCPDAIDVLAAQLGRNIVERKAEDIFVLHGR